MADFGWSDEDLADADDADEEDEQVSTDGSGQKTDPVPSEDAAGSESESVENEGDDPDESDKRLKTEATPEDDDVTEEPTSDDGEDPFGDLAGGSMNLAEAREREHLRRILIWGPEGVGKTHNVYTAPKPLAIIDTEDKAHDLATNFDVDPAKVRLWQPSDYPEARQALEEATEWLQAWLDERGERGTIAVDSISDIWDWSKVHYIEKYYIEPDPTGKYEDPSDVDLKSSLQSNDPDWPKIKQYHNAKFREPMIQTDFHVVWTAKATEDYGTKMEQSLSSTPMKPAGEKDNPYKVSHILRIEEDDDGAPLGTYEKPGVTQRTFRGLKWPTIPKVFDVVEDIQTAENTDEPVPPSEIEDEHGVELIKGKPSRLRGVRNGDSDE